MQRICIVCLLYSLLLYSCGNEQVKKGIAKKHESIDFIDYSLERPCKVDAAIPIAAYGQELVLYFTEGFDRDKALAALFPGAPHTLDLLHEEKVTVLLWYSATNEPNKTSTDLFGDRMSDFPGNHFWGTFPVSSKAFSANGKHYWLLIFAHGLCLNEDNALVISEEGRLTGLALFEQQGDKGWRMSHFKDCVGVFGSHANPFVPELRFYGKEQWFLDFTEGSQIEGGPYLSRMLLVRPENESFTAMYAPNYWMAAETEEYSDWHTDLFIEDSLGKGLKPITLVTKGRYLFDKHCPDYAKEVNEDLRKLLGTNLNSSLSKYKDNQGLNFVYTRQLQFNGSSYFLNVTDFEVAPF